VGPHGLRISSRCPHLGSGTRVRLRVRMLVSEASLDFRKRQFHHTRILSRVPRLHFKGSLFSCLLTLAKIHVESSVAALLSTRTKNGRRGWWSKPIFCVEPLSWNSPSFVVWERGRFVLPSVSFSVFWRSLLRSYKS